MASAYAYLSAYDRHKKLINDYFLLKGGSVSQLKRDTSRDKTDRDVIRENHQFLWEQEDGTPTTWGAQLAKKYYDKLFKEYCICDMTYYKNNKIALRWRTEREVVKGKGQFECANKNCDKKEDLRSWEVNFRYEEQGKKKNALVKLRLCPACAIKLNYHSQKREIKRNKSVKMHNTFSKIYVEKASSSVDDNTITTAAKEMVSQETVNLPETDEDTSKVWKEKTVDVQERSREEEFEEYLADLLM